MPQKSIDREHTVFLLSHIHPSAIHQPVSLFDSLRLQLIQFCLMYTSASFSIWCECLVDQHVCIC